MRKTITEIPGGRYVGYYWLSNEEKPVSIRGNFPSNKLSNLPPFIVEGNIFDAERKVSISIRHNGKEQVIHQYDLHDLSGFEKHEVKIIPHRLQGKGKVLFWELWREEVDILCANMKTLVPYARVFTGFEESKSDN